MPPAAVPAGEAGKQARCRGCGTGFVVRRRGEALQVEALAAAPPEAAGPSPAAPEPRRRRVRRRPRTKQPAEGTKTSVPSSGGTRPTAPLPGPAAAGAGEPFGIGDRVGRYEIEGVLARGGMGGIYKAYDPAANRHVALKVLVGNATELDRLRFQREIQVQGNIQHPHIMPIFDSGVIGSTRFYTMELLKDPLDLVELTELLHRGEVARDPKLRPLATIEGLVRRVVLPVCRAIHHANVNEGVLHRDLKPGNVLVDRHGLQPFLIDFGVSSLLEKKNARLAHLDRDLPVPLKGQGVRITGTLVFMPPEQARGRADRRGDVWGLGALLHYVVTNAPPLEGAVRPVVDKAERLRGLDLLIEQARAEGRFSEAREFEAKRQQVVDGTERTVEDLRQDVLHGRTLPRPAGIARELDAIIAKAMQPDPEQRYRHAGELADDLLAWLEGRPVRAMVQGSGTAGGLFYRSRLFLRRHRVWLAVLAVVVAGVVVGISAWPKGSRMGRAAEAERHMAAARAAEKAGHLQQARSEARAALRRDPERRDAVELLTRVDQAARLERAVERARALAAQAREAFGAHDVRLGRRRLAALEEVVSTRVLPSLGAPEDARLEGEMRGLLAFARDEQPLRVRGAPAGCSFSLYRVAPGPGPVRWDREIELHATEEGLAPDAVVHAGSWVLRIRRDGGEVLLPFAVSDGGTGAVLTCPLDPARVDPNSVYVEGGSSPGPGGAQQVPPLLWDRNEVTAAAYATFLATLDPKERRRRVPRLTGALGALGEPLWDARGDGFDTPSGASRRPVEGISLYDARAYAAWAKRRLPTAPEWAWAATGPDGRSTPVGTLRDLAAASVNVDRPLAGVRDVGSNPADRSPFGLFDMAGNVSEYTSTLDTLRGESGWFVMGGSYLTPASAALVDEARVVPGWKALQGVGIRCVRPVP
jgi:serine/threonine protein kinase